MRHPAADSPWFTFETAAASGFRAYAFSGFEEAHRAYEFEIELVHGMDDKVQFHRDRLGGREENTTCWIRTSQGWAGGQFGTMAIPRIGQEVLLAPRTGSSSLAGSSIPATRSRTLFRNTRRERSSSPYPRREGKVRCADSTSCALRTREAWKRSTLTLSKRTCMLLCTACATSPKEE